MFANYLIGLREGLEAALVVVILVAYLVKSRRRAALGRIWAGAGLATGLSLAFGALLTFGSETLTFTAQEAIGGSLSVLAVALVTWMVFWMARTARNLRGELHGQVDRHIDGGWWSLVLVAFLAVGREGLETALFIWSAIRATGQTVEPLAGAALGLLSAGALGWAIYRGMLRINLARFFGWTGAMLVIVAAGVLSYGIHDLQEAAILPGLNSLAFDLGTRIAPDSWYGTLLKGTFNFTPATTWLQAAAWAVYTIPAMAVFVWKQHSPATLRKTHPRSTPEFEGAQ